MLIAILIIALIVAAALYEKRSGADLYDRFKPPGRRVDIGGHKLYCTVQGERRPGQPLVVLEAGHGDWSKCWSSVYPELTGLARVFTYDRAGVGWSETGPLPRSPEQMVHELHKLLQCSGEPGPYLLVGHSMGGAISRLYYHFYPHEVVGMVWVDSAHEYLGRYMPFWKPALAGFLAALQLGRGLARLGLVRLMGKTQLLRGYSYVTQPAAQAELLAQTRGPRFFDWLYHETVGFARPENWRSTPTTLGDLPVIALEAQYTTFDRPLGCPAGAWRQFLQGWSDAHADLGRLSTCLRRVPVQTGHALMHEQPQAVIQAVAELLATVP